MRTIRRVAKNTTTRIFAVFTDPGSGAVTVREVARDKSLALKYLANISLKKVILVAIAFGLIALTINLMGYPQLVAGTIMGVFVYYFSQTTLFIVVPLSALIYFGILYITKYISNEDITLVKQVLRIKGADVD